MNKCRAFTPTFCLYFYYDLFFMKNKAETSVSITDANMLHVITE